MDWLNSVERAWRNSYHKAKAYFEENTNLDIPLDYRCDDGYTLGMWLYSQRKNWEKLNPDRQKLLLEIGFKPAS